MYTDDGVFEAHPGCVRAVRETAELLKNDGHDVVEVRFAFAAIVLTQFHFTSLTFMFQFHPPPMDELQQLYLGFTMADWGYELKKACGRDLYDSSTILLRTICLVLSLPRAVIFAIKWIASLISKISFPGMLFIGIAALHPFFIYSAHGDWLW